MRSAAAIRADGEPRFDEAEMSDLFDVLAPLEKPAHDAEDHPAMTADQIGERLFIASRGRANQLVIRLREFGAGAVVNFLLCL